MVNASNDAAPAGLEVVRALLNTWLIPNDTRTGTDRLSELSRDPEQWAASLAGLPRPGHEQVDELRQTRDALRGVVDDPEGSAAVLPWLVSQVERHAVIVMPGLEAGELTAAIVPNDSRDPNAVVLAAALEAARDGTWPRLKSCLDCRWVFFDHSRSATRKWCGMSAVGPNGRACGSISKVRAYRRRQAQGSP